MKVEGPFVQVPHSLYKDPRLSAYEKLVWSALMLYADEKGWCWPTIKTLAADTSLGEVTVKLAIRGYKGNEKKGLPAIAGLEQHGWLKVKVRRGRVSLYQLLVPEVSPRHKSGDVSVTLPNEVSRLSSGTSETPHVSPSTERNAKHSLHAESNGGLDATRPAGETPHVYELYPWNYIQKISLRTPGKKAKETSFFQTKAKDNDETCRFDSVTGHFVVGQAVRLRLEANYPRIDFDKSLPLIETRLPRDKSGKATPIYNAMPYLDSCFADFRNCVVKYGEEIRHTDGTVGRVKVYTDEESSLLYHAPLPERPLDATFNQLVGEILAKKRDT